jgi:rRNA-processing protein FCF1
MEERNTPTLPSCCCDQLSSLHEELRQTNRQVQLLNLQVTQLTNIAMNLTFSLDRLSRQVENDHKATKK